MTLMRRAVAGEVRTATGSDMRHAPTLPVAVFDLREHRLGRYAAVAEDAVQLARPPVERHPRLEAGERAHQVRVGEKLAHVARAGGEVHGLEAIGRPAGGDRECK